jgi:hypothetical protein
MSLRSRRMLLAVLLVAAAMPASAGEPPRPDPELAPAWYGLACDAWSGHLRDRIATIHRVGLLEEWEAAQFQSVVDRVSRGCKADGSRALRLFFDLEVALTDWVSSGPAEDDERVVTGR